MHYNVKVEPTTDILIFIGKAIKERRTQLGYSQEKLSELSKVHRNFISCIERGTRNATILTISQILTALETDIFQFMTEVNPHNNHR